MNHPRDVLLGAQAGGIALPVCDHYSGVEARMKKSLQLQAEMTEEFGACVFDVTLDCEDGAPVGGEAEHAAMVVELALAAAPAARVAVRVHPVDHPAFEADMALIAGRAGHRLCHIMIPKVESVDDVIRAEKALKSTSNGHLPLQVLMESPAAVHRAFEIAAHPRVQSLSFGLMDFVSAHGGAIPASAMGTARGAGSGRSGPVQPPAGAAGQARNCIRVSRARQGAFALRRDRVQRRGGDASRRPPRGPRAGLYPHVEHPSGPDPPDSGGFRPQ